MTNRGPFRYFRTSPEIIRLKTPNIPAEFPWITHANIIERRVSETRFASIWGLVSVASIRRFGLVNIPC